MWRDKGTCSYGKACKFQHAAEGTASPAKEESRRKAKTKVKHGAAAAEQQGLPDGQHGNSVTKAIEEYQMAQNELFDNYDARDYESDDSTALAFTKGKGGGKGRRKGKGKGKPKRKGKGFAKKPPCKFWILGNCTKGKDCPYFHGAQTGGPGFNKKGRTTKGAVATDTTVAAAEVAEDDPSKKVKPT
jgi:hypothetical protein